MKYRMLAVKCDRILTKYHMYYYLFFISVYLFFINIYLFFNGNDCFLFKYMYLRDN